MVFLTVLIMNKKSKASLNGIMLLIQLCLFILLIVFAIISIFNKNIFNIVQVIMTLLLFIMAYNNYKLYQKKSLCILYLVFGIISLVLLFI